MKAIILAAGKGTRVRPITHLVPKPMIPIIHKPVMETLVDLLSSHGVRKILVNTSYRAPDIENYFRDGSRFGVEMAYSFEGHLKEGRLVDQPVGSAGAIKKIQEHSGFFDETFAVLCGDAVIDIDLSELLRVHRDRNAIATIALANVPRSEVSNYGVVVADADGRVREFQEKPSEDEARSTTVNTGIYIFEPEIIDRIPAGATYDIGGELFPKLVAEGSGLYGATLPFQWLDIGRVADYYSVMQLALSGKINNLNLPGTQLAEGVWAGLNVSVDLAKCRIVPPVYIGGSTTIEPGATIIGPSMIGPGCLIEAGACVERSVIFEYTRIASRANVAEKMVFGGYCVDASGAEIDIGRGDFEWLIADARTAKTPMTIEQQQLLQMMTE
jgi:mannose-1-phosphate guanylyltransferase